MRRRSAIMILLAAPLAGAGAAEGQDVVWVQRSAPAWLGVSYDVHWLAADGTCHPRVMVETVVPGAPADRAGLRPGDAIVMLNDEPVGASRLQLIGSRLAPGDSVRMRVSRDGKVREMLAVADRRPDRPPTGLALRGNADFAASDAPVVRFSGDTLVARNLEVAGLRSARGYWFAYDDGRADYRRLDRFSGDAMDRRVADLVLCAATTRSRAPTPNAVRVDMRALQVRADSLREAMARRALTRAGAQEALRLRSFEAVELAPLSHSAELLSHPSEPPSPAPGASSYLFRVGDHVAAGARGVAGAEITPLEPELAEYFRGARDGLLVLHVAPGSPADRAGLRPGDVITSGGGRTLESVGELRLLLTLPDPSAVELRVVRHGRSRTITIPRD